MKRAPIYSASRRRIAPASRPPNGLQGLPAGLRPAGDAPAQADDLPTSLPDRTPGRWRAFLARHERIALLVGGMLLSLALLVAYDAWRRPAKPLSQQDIDAAVLHTLSSRPLPSPAAMAYEQVLPSVVLVRGHTKADSDRRGGPDKETEKGAKKKTDKDPARSQLPDRPRADGKDPDDDTSGIGSGVVIVDKGVILTNMHVVAGSDRISVTFADGTESPARIISLRPENDLAVLQAQIVPEDLKAATLRSTSDLRPGDQVIAIGFPFGIGPSVSSGVVSGLDREFESREGKRVLRNLIQFDAAANPGNSGGPLATMDGSVVGIVTAILNPTEERVFVGIGFAVPIENAASSAGSSPF